MDILKTFVMVGLMLVFIKVILGFAYFDFWQWHKQGNQYIKAHNEWMRNQP